jgi:hypothetical protein
MKTNQFITASVLGGVLHFFIGWLVYGILLADFMQSSANQSIMKKDNEMILWAIFIGSMGIGTLLTYIFSKSGVANMKSGFTTAAIVGALMATAMNFTSYGTANIFNNLQAVIIDIVTMAFVVGLPGAGIGYYLSMRKTEV